jgi:GTP-binding nuclear protein Ran
MFFLVNLSHILVTPKLDFVEAPALAPPEVPVDQQLMQQWNMEMNTAAQTALPEDDDGDDF